MNFYKFCSKVRGKYLRTLASRFGKRTIEIKTATPLISFTFDDAPKSAFEKGGDILNDYGAKATYYVSLGLLGTLTEVGNIASTEDLLQAVNEGNELGCHTYDHLDAWDTSKDDYIASILENEQALENIIPGAKFKTFAYPKNGAKLSVKSPLENRFACCRGGGQAANVGAVDLNMLKACFLDKRQNVDINFITNLIDYNSASKGWLIFVTHDIDENPSPFGCTPEFFQKVVDYASRSGALLLPVGEACERLLSL